ncbi:MAG: hypothetical protein JXJ17_05690 [Anaerolineae bacterium]|nr:hypothetical protein [Anaerolineae bacterium]
MRNNGFRYAIKQYARLAVICFLLLTLVVAMWTSAGPGVLAQPSDILRYGGYGISVGPWIDQRADLVEYMGMDWVKVYDTDQIQYYPNARILYRIERNGYPPEWEIDAWRSGLYDLAAELDARGVDAVEIANEVNFSAEWGGNPPNAAEYVSVLADAYTAFKAVAPHIIVVSGGLAPTDSTADGMNVDDFVFAQQMLDAGGAQYFDAFGYHPYGFNQPPEADPYQNPFSFRRTELMYKLLWDNGVRDKQIWITEFGWVRDPAEEGLQCSADPEFMYFDWMKVSRDVQADYTARAFDFAARNWTWAGPMFLWNLNWNQFDEGYESPCSHLRWYAILNRDGSPLPAVEAIRNLPRRPPLEYRPELGAVVHGMTTSGEAGCLGMFQLGSFEVMVRGEPEPVTVQIEPVNGEGRPLVSTSVDAARSGDTVDVFVDAGGFDPGIYMIAINLNAAGSTQMSSEVVRGWFMIHYPTTPQCVLRAGGF